jgi:hypothetical protein
LERLRKVTKITSGSLQVSNHTIIDDSVRIVVNECHEKVQKKIADKATKRLQRKQTAKQKYEVAKQKYIINQAQLRTEEIKTLLQQHKQDGDSPMANKLQDRQRQLLAQGSRISSDAGLCTLLQTCTSTTRRNDNGTVVCTTSAVATDGTSRVINRDNFLHAYCIQNLFPENMTIEKQLVAEL